MKWLMAAISLLTLSKLSHCDETTSVFVATNYQSEVSEDMLPSGELLGKGMEDTNLKLGISTQSSAFKWEKD